MGSVPFLVHVLLCNIILVDKDVNLELAMFAYLIICGVFILYKLTMLFWPNTCLVSMCIIGASGAVNKQV